MKGISKRIAILLLLIPVWVILYMNLEEIADFIVFRVLRMDPERHLTEAIRFFIFEVPKDLVFT